MKNDTSLNELDELLKVMTAKDIELLTGITQSNISRHKKEKSSSSFSFIQFSVNEFYKSNRIGILMKRNGLELSDMSTRFIKNIDLESFYKNNVSL